MHSFYMEWMKNAHFFSIKVSLETTRSVLIYKECTSFLIAIPS